MWWFYDEEQGKLFYSIFCSLAVLDATVGHTMDVLSPLSLSSVIVIYSSTDCPVHILMLSIQAVSVTFRYIAADVEYSYKLLSVLQTNHTHWSLACYVKF